MSSVDGIKNKLTDLSSIIRRNLLESSGDVTRKFVVDENDFLSILTLAIRFLHKSGEKGANDLPREENPEESKSSSQQPPPIATSDGDMKTVEGGGRSEPCVNLHQVESKKLRSELLRVLSDHIYPEEAKTDLLLDVFRRYENRLGVTRQQCLERRAHAQQPNVLVGGGKQTPSTGQTMNVEKDNVEGNNVASDRDIDDDADDKRKRAKNGPGLGNNPNLESNREHHHLVLARTWLDNAVETINNYMKNKINVIFLNNVKYHANKLSDFFEQKGILAAKRRAIFSPDKQFYLKNHSLFFADKHSKGDAISFDLMKLLVTISFTKNKIFKFLQYRDKFVTQFSKNDKKFLQIFIRAFPINRQRIPCKTIRDFAGSK